MEGKSQYGLENWPNMIRFEISSSSSSSNVCFKCALRESGCKIGYELMKN